MSGDFGCIGQEWKSKEHKSGRVVRVYLQSAERSLCGPWLGSAALEKRSANPSVRNLRWEGQQTKRFQKFGQPRHARGHAEDGLAGMVNQAGRRIEEQET